MASLTLDSALLGAIVLVLIALLSVTFTTRPVIAVPLLLLVEWANASNVTAGFMVGHFHIYPEDILTAALLVATLMRRLRRGNGLRPPQPLIVLLVIVLLGMARGAAAFGVQTSVVYGREMLAMCTAAVFFSTVRVTPKLILTVRNWLLVASAVFLIVAVRFWILHGFDTYATTGTRALDSLQTLIVLETTIFVTLFPPFRGPVLRFITPLVGIVIVLLSVQRTVWAAGIVAVAILVVAGKKSRGTTSLAARRLVMVAAVFAVVLLVAAGPSGVTSSLTAGIQQTSTSQNSTFSWRLQGWSVLISRQIDGPTVDLVLGSPTGTGYERIIGGGTVTAAPPHSEYVSALDLTGLLGIVLLVWVYAAALRRCRRRLRSRSPLVGQSALLFIVLLALQLTFFIAYSEGLLVGIMLGLAWGFVNGGDQDPAVNRPELPMPATTQRL
jgi:hypothetical protein